MNFSGIGHRRGPRIGAPVRGGRHRDAARARPVSLAPIPVLIAALGWNHRSGLVAASSAASPSRWPVAASGIGFALGWALPAWWLSYLALLGRPGKTASSNGIRSGACSPGSPAPPRSPLIGRRASRRAATTRPSSRTPAQAFEAFVAPSSAPAGEAPPMPSRGASSIVVGA